MKATETMINDINAQNVVTSISLHSTTVDPHRTVIGGRQHRNDDNN